MAVFENYSNSNNTNKPKTVGFAKPKYTVSFCFLFYTQ